MTSPLPVGPTSRRWRRIDRAILVAVFVALWVPAALLLAGVHASQIENRPLATLPPVTLGGLADGTWAAGVDAFVEDNIAPRGLAVRLRGRAYLAVHSTGSTQVIAGRGAWLFPRDALDPTCRHTAADVAAALDSAMDLAGRGITFRFLAIPDKQSIYPAQLESNPFPVGCTEQQRAALRQAIADHATIALDGWSLLQGIPRGSGPTLLYYPRDTHWTALGAIPVLKALVTSIQPGLWSDADVVEQGTWRHRSDLTRQLGVTTFDRTTKVVVRGDVAVTTTNLSLPFELKNEAAVFETRTSTTRPVVEGRALIVYDSFFGTQSALIAPWFRDAVWVHIGDLQEHPEIAQLTGPFSVVVVARVERFLYLDDMQAVVRIVGS
jgi:hypothetical protein